jgi:hypothetical protein
VPTQLLWALGLSGNGLAAVTLETGVILVGLLARSGTAADDSLFPVGFLNFSYSGPKA